MTTFVIDNAQLLDPGVGCSPGSIAIRDGKIVAVGNVDQAVADECPHMDAAGGLVTPGLIDIHTHGIHEYLYERGPEELLAGLSLLPRYGTTCVLPTLYATLRPESMRVIERLAASLEHVENVAVPGFHLEGPFLAIPGAGGSTLPGDVRFLDELLAAADQRVAAMSVSPETPGILPVIERLRERKIAVFLTHTAASVAETERAIAAGAQHATHFYDVFPVPPEEEPGARPTGAVEAILCAPSCTVDFICDGVHVDPIAIKLALAAKGPAGVIAITDSNVGAGSDDGVYPTAWGYSVIVSQGDAARVYDADHPLHGLLAGSSLTMNRAVANLHRWLDLPTHDIWAMATSNPARILGLRGKGRLEPGADADLVQWHRDASGFHAVRTWLNGHCVWEAESLVEAQR